MPTVLRLLSFIFDRAEVIFLSETHLDKNKDGTYKMHIGGGQSLQSLQVTSRLLHTLDFPDTVLFIAMKYLLTLHEQILT
jgi:hypothetical protein